MVVSRTVSRLHRDMSMNHSATLARFDDLEKVPGIGAATISKNKDSLSIGGKAAASAKPAAK